MWLNNALNTNTSVIYVSNFILKKYHKTCKYLPSCLVFRRLPHHTQMLCLFLFGLAVVKRTPSPPPYLWNEQVAVCMSGGIFSVTSPSLLILLPVKWMNNGTYLPTLWCLMRKFGTIFLKPCHPPHTLPCQIEAPGGIKRSRVTLWKPQSD